MQGKKSKKEMSDAQLEESARLFGILSEPSRLRLLRALMQGSLTVTELVEATGMKQGNVSKHLGVLLQARFVSRDRAGNFAHYRLADPRLPALCALMCQRIDEDLRGVVERLTSRAKS
jgi:DNA-binding transcriptional ArsR family regulator